MSLFDRSQHDKRNKTDCLPLFIDYWGKVSLLSLFFNVISWMFTIFFSCYISTRIIMDERKKRILVVMLCIHICTWWYKMCLICEHWLSRENRRMHWFWNIYFDTMDVKKCIKWAFKVQTNFIDKLFSSSCIRKMFKQRTWVSCVTFWFLCKNIRSIFAK